MAIRRVALRCVNAAEMTGSEQEDFAADVESRIEQTGADLGGYFICCGGTNWIELEGDKDAVTQVIDDHKNDSRVDATLKLEDVQPDQRITDDWRGHTQPDIYNEVT